MKKIVRKNLKRVYKRKVVKRKAKLPMKRKYNTSRVFTKFATSSAVVEH